MKFHRIRLSWLTAAVASLVVLTFTAPDVAAQSPVKLKGAGVMEISDGTSNIVLAGHASHLGRYASYGEVVFSPRSPRGTMSGDGVVVFVSANGDTLVGELTCQLNADGTGQLAVSWRDSVELSDGSIVETSGRFLRSPPPGIVTSLRHTGGVNGIIAVLIG